MTSPRDLFLRHKLAEIPKLLTLQDRNPHSPTYGCFDRAFWQYRTIDFPSGMAQEFVWPVALAWSLESPDNPYGGHPALRGWVAAGIRYAARSGHPDGSCDDYFPFEKAVGAAAFSLLACLESDTLIGLNDEGVLAFYRRRAQWLDGSEESGRLSNHQALIVLALLRLAARTGEPAWRAQALRRLERLLGWQSAEGWFPEYEGCDPGYLTLTVSLLAEVYRIEPSPDLRRGLERAAALMVEFLHPDGTYGGEYGSRDTLNYFPHGFERTGEWLPDALRANDGFLAGLAAGRQPSYADDHIVGHHAWNYLLAWRDFQPRRPAPVPRPAGRRWLREAGILIDRSGRDELYLGLRKGGSFKLFRDGELLRSDIGVSLRVRNGTRRRTAVTHMVDDYDIAVDDGRIRVAGTMGWAMQSGMTTPRLLALRVVMLLGGRFHPDLVRRLLQRLLITHKKAAPFGFSRTLRRVGEHWQLTDEITGGDWAAVVDAGIGGDQTSIYVVMSRVFQPSQLQAWDDLTTRVRSLAPGATLRIEREL